MILGKEIKKAFAIIVQPEKEFNLLNRRTFEEVLSDYIKLLIGIGIAAGIFNFLYTLGKVLYFAIFMQTDVQYFRMINYVSGTAFSIAFFCWFAGTFILFLLSLLIKPFFKRIKHTKLLQVMMYALMPSLLFGWLTYLIPGLIVWGIILFIIGIKSLKIEEIKKDSIQHR